MKSVLRELQHLAAFPNLGQWELPDDDPSPKGVRIATAREVRSKRARAIGRAALKPVLRGYLFGRQHDAQIQSFRREGDRLTITVHDDDLAALANFVYGAPWNEVEMPFDLVFEGVRYVGWRWIEYGGKLLFSPPPSGLIEWLDDEILPSEGTEIRWGLLVHASEEHGRRPHRRLLLVEAMTVRVVERQRDAWRTKFGEASLALLDHYAALRPQLALTQDQRGLAQMRAFAEAHGLATRD